MGQRFENFKLKLHNRIKKGTIEANLNGERVLMKYQGWNLGFIDLRDWHRIYPAVIEENGKLKFVLSNFLYNGKKNGLKLIGIILIVGLVLLSVYDIVRQYNQLVSICKPVISALHL